MITTTLNRIRKHHPCEEGWKKLLTHLGKTKADDEPLPFAIILASNGLDDALWCCRCEPQHDKVWRELTWQFASSVRHLMKDERSTRCLDVVRRHIDGAATDKELKAARAAAWAVAREAAREVAGDAAWAVARAATWAATWAAAGDAQKNTFTKIVG